jgi:hypothetical protein
MPPLCIGRHLKTRNKRAHGAGKGNLKSVDVMKTIEQLVNEAKESLTFERGWRSRLFLYPNQRDTSGDSSPEAQAVYWIFVLLAVVTFVLIVAF